MRMMLAKMFCRKMARRDKIAEEGAEPISGVGCVEDVPFYRDLTADVYSPCGGHDLPAVLDVHGGGLMYGDKRLNRRFCAALASCGFTVVSADYRLFPEASFRDAAEDVARAAEFTARVYGKNGFYLAGDSAGAELALIADGAAASEKVRAAFGIDGKLAPPSDGLFLICGAFAFGKSVATALMGIKAGKGDYMKYTSADALFGEYLPRRVYLSSGKGDFLRRKTLKMHELLSARNVPVELDYVPTRRALGGRAFGHVFPVRHPEWSESDLIIRRAARFLHGVPHQSGE